MKFEKLNQNKKFYEQWKSKYWWGRQWYQIIKIIDNQIYLKVFGGAEYKSFNKPDSDFEIMDSTIQDREIIVELEWFRSREKNIRQPKD